MIQILKRLFGSKKQEVVELTKKQQTKEYPTDQFGQIVLDHNKEKNYEHYLFEIEKGATHYRVIEDRKKNFVYDCDDMEDHYCHLTIEIRYKDKLDLKRYSLMGECTKTSMTWNKIPRDLTPEQINDFIIDLNKPRIW